MLMFKMYFLNYLIVLELIVFILPMQAQFNDPNVFGKNRLQYNKKEWRYVESDNFIFYYYDAGYQVATFAAEYAESNLKDICNAIGHYPLRRIKIFIYTSINHQQQSNIGIYYQDFDKRGQTSFTRAEIEIAYTGSREDFKKKIRLSLADKLIFNMIYGEDFKDVLKNSVLLFLQPWFLSGASKYLAEGWTTEVDDYIRYAIPKNHFKRLSRLEKQQAQLMGQAIWNYIAIKYGANQIPNILNTVRITRNDQYALYTQLRIPYSKLIKDVEKYYRVHYDKVIENYILPSKNQILVKPLGKVRFSNLNISPDGQHLAVGQNRKGALKVKIYDLDTKKRKAIIRRSYQVVNQEVGQNSPLIDWRDDAKIGVFILHREKNYFYTINLKKKRQDERYFRTLSNIQNFKIHPNKTDQFLISGEVNTKSNIYQYFYTDRKLYKITDDDYEDLDPIYRNNAAGQIIFSSNRPITSDEIPNKSDLFRSSYNLFLYTPAKTDNPNILGTIEPVTRTLNINIQPKLLNQNELLFLSDSKGIMNLYKYDFNNKTIVQLTNYRQSIKTYTFKNDDLYLVFGEGAKDVIYKIADFDFSRNTFTLPTPRQVLFNKLKSNQIRTPPPPPLKPKLPVSQKTNWRKQDISKHYQPVPADSIVQTIDPEQYIFNYLPANFLPDVTKSYNYNYFSKTGRQKFLKRLQKSDASEDKDTKPKLKITDKTDIFSLSRDYEPEFALDRIDLSPFYDPIRNLSLLTQLFMTDIFENHKINVKYFGLTDFKNTNIKIEYLYLKKQIDYSFRYEQQNIRQGRTVNFVSTADQLFNNKLEFGMSYPYSVAGSFNFNTLVMLSNFTDSENQMQVRKIHLGYRAEYIFDNTLIFDINTQEGIKARINYEQFFDLKSVPLGILTFDGRYYYRLNYNITLAGRLSGGRYLGTSVHRYAVGGVTNDLLSRTLDREDPNSILNDLSGVDLVFARFATSVRGYNINEVLGRNYLISNTELRVPIISYSYRQHITSLFLRYLQFIAFVDMGTVWDNGLPFGTESYEQENIINNANFNIRVVSYRSPLLMSYGFGVSSYLLGFYLKLEYGFQVSQFSVDSDTSLAHLSIGLNF